jgi:hypothetical protein
LAVCLNISTVINIKILTNSNQQTQSYKFTSHIAAFLSVVLITEMLEICIQTSYDQNIQLILKSYLPVVYGTPLRSESIDWLARNQDNVSKWRDDLHMDSCFSELTLYKANLACWSSKERTSNVTCSRHDVDDKMLVIFSFSWLSIT